jgi:hypothetical protein
MAVFSFFSMLSGPNRQNGMENAAQGSVLGPVRVDGYCPGTTKKGKAGGAKICSKKVK